MEKLSWYRKKMISEVLLLSFHKLSFSYVKEFLISYFFIFSSQANIKPITPE